MKALSPIHKIVAREVALGISLAEVCKMRQLDFETWKRIAEGKLFKSEVSRIMTKVEDEMVMDEAENPVVQKLKANAMKAVDSLINEVNNHDKEDDGASSNTRISASKTLLELAGFTKKEEQKMPTVVISISSSKAASLSLVDSVVVIPENVLGKAHV